MNAMTIRLPHNEPAVLEYGKPVVVLGANGSGKTRFSVKIEELNDHEFNFMGRVKQTGCVVHRLSAQKSLTIPDTISIKDSESSERNLFVGSSRQSLDKNTGRYSHNPATCMINDYEQALSYLFAVSLNALQKEHNANMIRYNNGESLLEPSETVADKAVRIWNKLLPHRNIDLSGNGVHIEYNGQRYHGKEMSDGERVMLYMIAQALIVRPHSLFIIDEPEQHIHRAVVRELWTLLENERPDCVFMYITHDIDFALSRNNARFLWIKNYDGNVWEYDFIEADKYSDFPSDLLLEILGTRQKILFVEGTKDSPDYKLYQEIYRDKGYHVIPCGGCQEVIRLVKAKNTYQELQMITVQGLIDRDYRTEHEIELLERDGIFTLKVAEVENLFAVPELLDITETRLGSKNGTAHAAKDSIVELFRSQRHKQEAEALSRELSHQFSLFDIGKEPRNAGDIKAIIDQKYSISNIEQWQQEKEKIFDVSDDLTEILKVFNYKGLSRMIASKFELQDKNWIDRILNLITKDSGARSEILAAISHYLPDLPQ